jgi:hypothetical protein
MSGKRKIPKDVLMALNYRSAEEAALDMVLLSARAKRAQFLLELERFETKYGMGFEAFRAMVESREGEEVFVEEDDLMAWRFAKEAADFWRGKVEELERAA